MKLRISCQAMALGACLTIVIGNGESQAAQRAATLTIKLHATSYNAGRIGQATLIPQGASTRIVLRFSGVPNYVGRPIHVYTYVYAADCANLSSTPVWSLNDRVLPTDVTGTPGGTRSMLSISHILPASLPELRSHKYSVVLRTAPADGDQPIFCGEIGPG